MTFTYLEALNTSQYTSTRVCLLFKIQYTCIILRSIYTIHITTLVTKIHGIQEEISNSVKMARPILTIVISTIAVMSIGLVTPVPALGIPEIYQVSESKFDNTTRLHEIVLLEFFDPACEYCIAFAPKYRVIVNTIWAAYKSRPAVSSAILFGTVDVTKERQLTQQHQITAVPTLILYTGLKSLQYFGELEVKPVVDWVLANTHF